MFVIAAKQLRIELLGCPSDCFDVILLDEAHNAETVRRLTLTHGVLEFELAPNSVLALRSVT